MFEFGSRAYYIIFTTIAASTLGLGYLVNYPWLGLMTYLVVSSFYLMYTVYNDHATALPTNKVLYAAWFSFLIDTVGIAVLIRHGAYRLPLNFISSGVLLFFVGAFFILLYLHLETIFATFDRTQQRQGKP